MENLLQSWYQSQYIIILRKLHLHRLLWEFSTFINTKNIFHPYDRNKCVSKTAIPQNQRVQERQPITHTLTLVG